MGKSKRIKYRWNEHKKNYKNLSTPLYRSFNKYGLDNFSFEVVKLCKEKHLDKYEKKFIKKLNTKIPYGYNKTDGGDGGQTYIWDEERKLRQAKTTILPNYSDNRLGKKNTKEHNLKISKARKLTNGMKGKKHSQEWKDQMREKLKYQQYNTNIIEMVNLQTGETKQFSGLTHAEEETGIKKGTIWYRIKNNVNKDGVIFQYKL